MRPPVRMPPSGISNKLQRSDARHFVGSDLYSRAARATCRADAAIPRKELTENWAMAERIHDHYFASARRRPPARVVDACAGHGLLGWFLLALCATPRTAPAVVYAVDTRMPDSACRVRDAFVREFSGLGARHRYVVGSARDVRAGGDTLIAALHACGSLSDAAIDAATDAGAPLALVPCCHSAANLPPGVAADADGGLDAAIDGARARRLAAAGYAVERDDLCSPTITPKNQLFLARPRVPGPPAPATPYPRALPPLSFAWRGSRRGVA